MSSKEFTEHLAYESCVIDPLEKIEVYLQKICFYLDRGPVTYDITPKEEDYVLKFTKGDIEKEEKNLMPIFKHWASVQNTRVDKVNKGKFT